MKVGSLEVIPLVDAEGSFAKVSGVFPELASDEEWFLPMTAFLVRGTSKVVLVDTGLGPEPRTFMPGAGAHLLDALAHSGLEPGEVELVVHTHLHIDHVGWNGSFPNARHAIHDNDWSYFVDEEQMEQRPHLRERVAPLGEAGLVDLFDARRRSCRCSRPTPGHTPGRVEVGGGGGGDPDVVYVSDANARAAAATRRELLGRLADAGTDVYVSHFHGVGRFARDGSGFRWTAKEQAPPVE